MTPIRLGDVKIPRRATGIRPAPNPSSELKVFFIVILSDQIPLLISTYDIEH